MVAGHVRAAAALMLAGSCGVLAAQTTHPPDRGPNAMAKDAPRMPAGLEKIQHFVFIMQENRSFDSYFGTYPGVEGLPAHVCLSDPTTGVCVAPYHDTNNVNRGGPHGSSNAPGSIDGGAMDVPCD